MRPLRKSLSSVLLLLALGVSACAHRSARPRYPGAIGSTPPDLTTTKTFTDAIVQTALSLQGSAYRNGGTDEAGFDCSGLVLYVFARHGVALPRSVREQYDFGDPVSRAELEPGDLVFFATVARGPSHVGIVIDDDLFVHAPSGGGVVRAERLSTNYWARRYLGARRVRQVSSAMSESAGKR